MTPQLELRVLGPLEASRAGRPCPISSPLQRRLLTALTVRAGTTSSTEQLIDLLWGHDPPPAARNSLQSHVARLRATIGDGAILTRPPGYALDPTDVAIDAIAFERSVERAGSQLERDPSAAVSTLRDALGEWRGAAYAEFAENLARVEAVRLENLRVDARGLLADAYLRVGDHPAAVDTLLRLQGDVPLREDITVATARTLHAVERTSEALEVLRRYRTRLSEELGLDPGHTVAELEQRLLRGEVIGGRKRDLTVTTGPRDAPREPSTELPGVAPTPPPYTVTETLGREEELTRIERELSAAHLVTLVGPGGVGKTRLATVAARELSQRKEHRIAWVDLASVTSPADVAPLTLECLGLTSPDRAAPATAAAALARFPGLVVLDNCEHVIEAVAELVGLVLTCDNRARMLATSRERLDVAGEQVVLVTPLPIPQPQAASEQDPAVRLFQERLAATDAATVTAAEAARVVAAVDGLPLGIELAAARAATLPIDDLLDRLSQHLDILAGSPRRHGERHRTLTSVIAWSYGLLEAREQVVLRRASVFASSFRLADAEQVCADAEVSASEVVAAIARLVETSMVMRVGTGRYRLLEPLRLFAREQLRRSGDEDATWARHRANILALVERADVELTGPREVATIAELEDALPDLRAVHERAATNGDLATVARMAGQLYRFAYAQARGDVLSWGARLAEGREPCDIDPAAHVRAIAASVPAQTWHHDFEEAERLAAMSTDRLDDPAIDPWCGITLAETLADLHLLRGELDEAVASYEKGVDLARSCGHTGLIAYMMSGLAIATSFLGDRRRGALLAEEAGELARRTAAPTAISLASYALGEALSEDEPDQALQAFQVAVDTAAAARAHFFEAIARTADVALRGRHGAPEEAFGRYREALTIWSGTSADGMAATTLRNLVVLLARTGADADALTLSAVLERITSRRVYGPEADRLHIALASVRQRLSSDAQRQAEEASRSVADLAEAIQFGLSSIDRAAQG